MHALSRALSFINITHSFIYPIFRWMRNCVCFSWKNTIFMHLLCAARKNSYSLQTNFNLFQYQNNLNQHKCLWQVFVCASHSIGTNIRYGKFKLIETVIFQLFFIAIEMIFSRVNGWDFDSINFLQLKFFSFFGISLNSQQWCGVRLSIIHTIIEFLVE